MLRSGQFIPSASWVLPGCQGGMEYNRVVALWKCMINPQAIEMNDVTQIFLSIQIHVFVWLIWGGKDLQQV